MTRVRGEDGLVLVASDAKLFCEVVRDRIDEESGRGGAKLACDSNRLRIVARVLAGGCLCDGPLNAPVGRDGGIVEADALAVEARLPDDCPLRKSARRGTGAFLADGVGGMFGEADVFLGGLAGKRSWTSTSRPGIKEVSYDHGHNGLPLTICNLLESPSLDSLEPILRPNLHPPPLEHTNQLCLHFLQ